MRASDSLAAFACYGHDNEARDSSKRPVLYASPHPQGPGRLLSEIGPMVVPRIDLGVIKCVLLLGVLRKSKKFLLRVFGGRKLTISWRGLGKGEDDE